MNIDKQVRYRDNNQCQARKPGCTHGCDTVQHVMPTDQLEHLHKDPDSPDTYWCICDNCKNGE